MPRRDRRQTLRAFIRKQKNKPCMDCRKQFPPVAMSFDHVRGKKLFNLGGSLVGKTMQQVIDELLKCEIVCLNCHAIREEGRRA